MLMPPFSLAVNRMGMRFSPENLFRSGDLGFYSNTAPSYGKTFQGAQASTLASSIGDPIGLIKPLNTASNVGILDGTTTASFSTPDAAGLDITGDIVFDGFVFSLAATGVTNQLATKWVTTGSQRSFQLYVDASQIPTLQISSDGGGTQFTYAATAAITTVAPAGTVVAFRASLDVNNGSGGSTATFEYSLDLGQTWAQLGNTVTQASVVSIFASTAPLEFGGSSSLTRSLRGSLSAGRIYADLARADLRASFNVSNYVSGSTFSSGGATYTLNGTAVIVPDVSWYQTTSANRPTLDQPFTNLWLPKFDGSNDRLITGLTKFGTSKLFADATAEPSGFFVAIPFKLDSASADGVLFGNTNIRVTWTQTTGVISVLCRGTSTDLTSTTITSTGAGILVINYDGGTSLTAMLNTLTPQTVTIGANADAGAVITAGSTSAGATFFKGWLLPNLIDASKSLAQRQNTIQYYAQLMGVTLV